MTIYTCWFEGYRNNENSITVEADSHDEAAEKFCQDDFWLNDQDNRKSYMAPGGKGKTVWVQETGDPIPVPNICPHHRRTQMENPPRPDHREVSLAGLGVRQRKAGGAGDGGEADGDACRCRSDLYVWPETPKTTGAQWFHKFLTGDVGDSGRNTSQN
jgi:hypothetical protein